MNTENGKSRKREREKEDQLKYDESEYFQIYNNNYIICIMGNEKSKNDNPIFKKYIQMEKEHHELIGQIMVVKSREANLIFSVKQFRYASQYDHSAALKKMQRRKVVSNKKHASNMIKLVSIENSVQDDVCGMTFFLYCIFQKIQITLNELILQRKFKAKQFREEEIMAFLRSVSSGILFMHDNNLRNYFPTKESIIANEDGNFKILDTEISTQLAPYTKIYNGIPIKKGVYLSPQLIEELILKNNDPDFSTKSDIFTLGVIALEMCSGEELDSFYDYNKLILNLEGLKQKINQINYSLYLKQLLLEMIEPIEDDRIGLLSLKEKLSPNDNKSTTEYSQIQKSSMSKGYPTTKNSFLPVQYNESPQFMNQQLEQKNNEKPMIHYEQRKRIHSFQNFNPKPSLSPINIRDNLPPLQHKRQGSIDRGIPVGRIASKSFNRPTVNINFGKANQRGASFQKDEKQAETPISLLNELNITNKQETYFNNANSFQRPSLINKLTCLDDYETPFKANKMENNLGSTPIRKVQALQSNKQSPDKDYLNKNKLTSDFIGVSNNYGKHHFSNGAIYEGQFDLSKNFSGSGILYYPNGSICYSGSWFNNSFHGFGILYNEKVVFNPNPTNYKNFTLNNSNGWQRYEGEFKIDKKDGFGTLYFSNGDKFSGCFCQDIVQGYGTFTSVLGQIVAGIWKDNILK